MTPEMSRRVERPVMTAGLAASASHVIISAGHDRSRNPATPQSRRRQRLFQPPLLLRIACQARLLPDGSGAILQPENEVKARWLSSHCAKLGRALRSVTMAVHANLHECITHRNESSREEG